MLSIKVDPNDPRSLVDQVVAGISRQIDERCLRPGTKLPSIRKLAESYGISRFTVVESYDRLVAQGYLEARRGAGFFTTAAREAAIHHMPSDGQKRTMSNWSGGYAGYWKHATGRCSRAVLGCPVNGWMKRASGRA